MKLVHGRIADAAKCSGRAADDITLIAVSKTWPAEVVREAVEAGQTVFGENKVQEGIEKVPVLPSNLDWHLIGHLQKNKVRKAITLFSWIETIDSLKLAQRIDHIAADEGVRPKILLQVNVGEDEAKSGYSTEGVRRDLESFFALEQIEIHGLMTIPPFDPDSEKTRPTLRRSAETAGRSRSRLWSGFAGLIDGHEPRFRSRDRGGRDLRPGRDDDFREATLCDPTGLNRRGNPVRSKLLLWAGNYRP